VLSVRFCDCVCVCSLCHSFLGLQKNLPNDWNIGKEIWNYPSSFMKDTKPWLTLLSKYEFVWDYWKTHPASVKASPLPKFEFSEIVSTLLCKLNELDAKDPGYSCLFWLWEKIAAYFGFTPSVKCDNSLQYFSFTAGSFTIVLYTEDMFKIWYHMYSGDIPPILNVCAVYYRPNDIFSTESSFCQFYLDQVVGLTLSSSNLSKFQYYHRVAHFSSFWTFWGLYHISKAKTKVYLSPPTWEIIRKVLRSKLGLKSFQDFSLLFWILFLPYHSAVGKPTSFKMTNSLLGYFSISDKSQQVLNIDALKFCQVLSELFSDNSEPLLSSAARWEVLSFLQSNIAVLTIFIGALMVKKPNILNTDFERKKQDSYNLFLSIAVSWIFPFSILPTSLARTYDQGFSQYRHGPIALFLRTFSVSSSNPVNGTLIRGAREELSKLVKQFGEKYLSLLPKEIFKKILYMKTFNDCLFLLSSMRFYVLSPEKLGAEYQKDIPEILKVLLTLLIHCDVDHSTEGSRKLRFQCYYYRLYQVLTDIKTSDYEKIIKINQIVRFPSFGK
jgi:hypothetical protein